MSAEKVHKTIIAAAKSALIPGVVSANAVAWPNKNFTPPTRAKWVSVSVLPAPVEALTCGSMGQNEATGILQFNCYMKKGSGDAHQRELAEAIEDWFQFGKSFTFDNQTVTFTKTSRGQGFPSESGHWGIPVSVEYESLFNRNI